MITIHSLLHEYVRLPTMSGTEMDFVKAALDELKRQRDVTREAANIGLAALALRADHTFWADCAAREMCRKLDEV